VKEDVQEPAWAAILSLTLGTFALVTSEFLPASLLSPMAADLHISEGVAGQAVTVTALVGALVAPTIAIATRRFDRRHVMLTLSALLIMSNSMVSLSQSIQTLLVARIFLGTALAGFWAMSAAMAARLVPAPSMAKAMSLIFAGASAATVCAVPTGAFIGAIAGWRTVFVIGAVLGAVALIAQMIYLPRMRPTDAPTFGTLRDVALRVSNSGSLLSF
jgi:DHA1 family purine ribonucleoside efflux pump-like MFS transporter